ncbi:MAG: BatA domain-containing protein [Acidobacteria bacterium]|nr:BatA domain-containing protein [Acidobacteriota bacterium]
MQFLSPWFFAGLLAFGIPLWLHLFRREGSRRFPFSSLMLMRKISRKPVWRKTLRYRLLLVLRLVFLLFLAAAFARPFLKESGVTMPTRASQRLVILALDTSLSMSYGNRWAEALDRAGELLDRGTGTERFQIMAFDTETRILNLPSSHRGELRTVLGQIRPRNRATDFSQALEAARQAVESSDLPEKSVHLVSDFQKTGWTGGRAFPRFPPGVQLRLHPLGGPAGNGTVEDVRVRPQIFSRTYPDRLLVRAAWYGTEEQRREVRLQLNDQVVSSRTVLLRPGEASTLVFENFLVPEGAVRGRLLLLPPDPLPQDDAYHFALDRRDPYGILLLTEPAGAADTFYFQQAIRSSTDSPFRIEQRPPRSLPALEPFVLVVLTNPGEADPPITQRLRAFVERGGTLLMTLGPESLPERVPAELQALSPAKLKERVYVGAEKERFTSVGTWNKDHFLFGPFVDLEGTSLPSAQFYGYVLVEPHPQASVLARFQNGAPLLLERSMGKGRVLLYASSLGTRWNELPLRGSYVPLMQQIARYAAGLKETGAAYRVGEVLPAAPAGEARQWNILTPAGKRWSGRDLQKGGLILEEIGFYEVRDQKVTQLVAVNVPAPESRLDPMAKEDLRAWEAGSQGAPSQTVATAALTERERNQNLWWGILALALALLLTETLFSKIIPSADRPPNA